MKRGRVLGVLGAVLAALVMVWVTTSALAMAQAQPPGSEGTEGSLGAPTGGPDNSLIVGDDPDEDGYTGLVAVGAEIIALASDLGYSAAPGEAGPSTAPQPDENGNLSVLPAGEVAAASASEADTAGLPDWAPFFQEPQPDQNAYYLSRAADISGAGFSSTFSYLHVTGATLRPRNSTTAWTYGGAGCVYSSVAGDVYNIHMDIPEGSRVDYLRLYYYDTSANNSTAWLTSYDDVGGFADLTSVSSSGTAGYGTALSALISTTLNYAGNSYVLNWAPNQAGNTMRLCGLRLAYRLPN